MSESDRLDNDVEYMISSDSTISFVNNKGAAALKAALLQELQNRATAANATIHNFQRWMTFGLTYVQ
eukprot:6649762-Pyramimonas_sp.AAC.1